MNISHTDFLSRVLISRPMSKVFLFDKKTSETIQLLCVFKHTGGVIEKKFATCD